MPLALRFAALAAALSAGPVWAGNARLLASDAAEVLERPVLGLQRSAVPLAAGLALDTSLLADLALAPNLGLRWARKRGAHRFVAGVRYTHFVGTRVYSAAISAQEPIIRRFDPSFSGPSAYALYGLQAGRLLVQGEARYSGFTFASLSFSGAAVFNFTQTWGAVLEAGVRVLGSVSPRGALGLRYQGEHLGLSLGAAYVGLEDPLLPGERLPVLPAVDLSWSFG